MAIWVPIHGQLNLVELNIQPSGAPEPDLPLGSSVPSNGVNEGFGLPKLPEWIRKIKQDLPLIFPVLEPPRDALNKFSPRSSFGNVSASPDRRLPSVGGEGGWEDGWLGGLLEGREEGREAG